MFQVFITEDTHVSAILYPFTFKTGHKALMNIAFSQPK